MSYTSAPTLSFTPAAGGRRQWQQPLPPAPAGSPSQDYLGTSPGSLTLASGPAGAQLLLPPPLTRDQASGSRVGATATPAG